MTELQREPDPKLMRELEAWGNAHDSYSVARTDKEKRSIEVEKRDIEKEICDYLKSKAIELEGMRADDEAMVQALAALEIDSLEAERIIREHFSSKPPPVVVASSEWRDENEPVPVIWRDDRSPTFEDSVVSKGEVAVLAGAGKTGKSFLTVSLAVAAAKAKHENKDFCATCGLRIRAGRVVLVSYEDSPKRIDMRTEAMDGHPGDVWLMPNPPPIYGFNKDSRQWDTLPTWRAAWQAIHAAAPVLVVIDTGPKAMGGETTDSGAVIGFLQALEYEARNGAFGVLVTAHDTKAARDAARSGADLGAGAIAGSSQWHDSPRGALHLTKLSAGDADRILEAVKCSYGRDGWGALLSPLYRDGGTYSGLQLTERLSESAISTRRDELKGKSKSDATDGSRLTQW